MHEIRWCSESQTCRHVPFTKTHRTASHTHTLCTRCWDVDGWNAKIPSCDATQKQKKPLTVDENENPFFFHINWAMHWKRSFNCCTDPESLACETDISRIRRLSRARMFRSRSHTHIEHIESIVMHFIVWSLDSNRKVVLVTRRLWLHVDRSCIAVEKRFVFLEPNLWQLIKWTANKYLHLCSSARPQHVCARERGTNIRSNHAHCSLVPCASLKMSAVRMFLFAIYSSNTRAKSEKRLLQHDCLLLFTRIFSIETNGRRHGIRHNSTLANPKSKIDKSIYFPYIRM